MINERINIERTLISSTFISDIYKDFQRSTFRDTYVSTCMYVCMYGVHIDTYLNIMFCIYTMTSIGRLLLLLPLPINTIIYLELNSNVRIRLYIYMYLFEPDKKNGPSWFLFFSFFPEYARVAEEG